MAKFLGWSPSSQEPALNGSIVPSESFLPNIYGNADSGNRDRALWSDDAMNCSDTFDLKKWKAECDADIASILSRRPEGYGRMRRRTAKRNRVVMKLPQIHSSCQSRAESQNSRSVSAGTDGMSDLSKGPSEDEFDPVDDNIGLICRGNISESIRLREAQNHDRACARAHIKQVESRKCRRRAKAWQKKISRHGADNVSELEQIPEEEDHEKKQSKEKVDNRILKILNKLNLKGSVKQAVEEETRKQRMEDGPQLTAEQDEHVDDLAINFLKKIRPEGKVKDRMRLLKRLRRERQEREEEEQLKLQRQKKFEAMPVEERECLWEAFRHFDQDNSHSLDIRELRACLTELGIRGSTAEEKQAISSICSEVSVLSSICPELLKLMSHGERKSLVRESVGQFGQKNFEVDFFAFSVDLVPAVRARLKKIRSRTASEVFMKYDKGDAGHINIKAMGQALASIKESLQLDLSCLEQVQQEVLVDPETQKRITSVDFELFQTVLSTLLEHSQRRQRTLERKIQEESGISEGMFEKVRSELVGLWDMFHQFDTDGSGYLDCSEYLEMIKGLGLLPRAASARPEIDQLIRDTWDACQGLPVRDSDSGRLVPGESLDERSSGIDLKSFVSLIIAIREKNGERKTEELMKIFSRFDRDRSGELNVSEISNVLEEMGMNPKTKEEQEIIFAIIQDVDDKGTGELVFEAFQVLIQRYTERLRIRQLKADLKFCSKLGFSEAEYKEFRQCFDQFDKDGSNSLDVREVRAVLCLLHLDVSAERLREAFDKLDRDGSGELEFTEFVQLMKMMSEKEGIFKGLHEREMEQKKREAKRKEELEKKKEALDANLVMTELTSIGRKQTIYLE
eukprot:gnl/MRDRNA2_/MRDRNA2_94571_c0_seq1.p1 gnl/MRDRNA2_/MRDRNA2_94571_c0~~gnl/MRDRNA2_/MRDRNA2_94571_c0_seq1.p1  ORF type:complete len:853 (-),score=198.59 gnl/MRDRNA2_/MRDRNA2_94571_c0_seq1:40-2598(-)